MGSVASSNGGCATAGGACSLNVASRARPAAAFLAARLLGFRAIGIPWAPIPCHTVSAAGGLPVAIRWGHFQARIALVAFILCSRSACFWCEA